MENSANQNLTNNNSINESEAILKYFFLLDYDKICKTVTDNMHSDLPFEVNLNKLFQIVYDSIQEYTTFISGTDAFSSIPFFGEFNLNEYSSGLSQILYITLRDNCIIHSYLSHLHQTNKSTEIRAKNEFPLTHGYYAFNNPCSNFKSLDIAQSAKYYSKYLRCKNNSSRYTYSLLNLLNNKENNFLVVPEYSSSMFNFLLCDNEVANFNKCLSISLSPTSFLKKYNYLFNSCQFFTKDSLTDNLDQFLFHIEMNAIYGFDFFKDIDYLFKTLDDSTISSHPEGILTLKDLDGTSVLDIITSASSLPLYCNKFAFLKYALYAVTDNLYLDATYLNENPKIVMTKEQIMNSNILSRNRAFELMENYFLLLRNITIPLLYTLWDSVFDSTFLTNKKSDSALPILEDYIRENNNRILSSYSQLGTSIITDMGQFYTSYNNPDYPAFEATIAHTTDTLKNINTFSVENAPMEDSYKLLPNNFSKDFKYLIENYCSLEPLLEYRFPFFAIKANEKYIPIKQLVTSLITPSAPNTKQPHPDLARNNFYKEHLSALNQFLLFSK